ncbi:Leucine--tRNA ligase [Dirofilaria immitis]
MIQAKNLRLYWRPLFRVSFHRLSDVEVVLSNIIVPSCHYPVFLSDEATEAYNTTVLVWNELIITIHRKE